MESHARALSHGGHEVELFDVRTDEVEGSPLYRARSAFRVATGRGRSPIEDIRGFGPDIVHVHNLFPNFGTRWVNGVQAPLVVTLHNFRPLCANAVLFRDGQVCTLCPDGHRFSGVRYACYRGSRIATLPLAWANRNGPMSNPLIQRADRIVILSERAREIYRGAGVPDQKLVVWPNFLADDLVTWSSTSPPEAATWLYVGRIGPEKGILRLAEVWPPDRELVVVGDGPDMTTLRRRIADTRIRLLGLRPRAEVLELMQRSVGLVFPSLCFESFPLVYAEAMAAGLPILAWQPNVIADAVEDQGTGMATSWADDVAAALSRAEDVFPSLRARCRSIFDETMSELAFRARAESLYRSLIVPSTSD